jgi:hypothetical protein
LDLCPKSQPAIETINTPGRALFTPDSDRGGDPSRVKAMGLCHGAACKLSLWSERLGRNASAEPSTKDALKLFVSVPSLLQVHPSIETVS